MVMIMSEESIEDILKLPDFTEIHNKFTGKYKNDIIIKHDINNVMNYVKLYILYKRNDDTYICINGRITFQALREDSLVNDCVIEWENLVMNAIECDINGNN